MNDVGDSALPQEDGQESATTYREIADPPATAASAHLVQFYDDDESLAAAVARFVAEGLSAGDVITTIATDEHARAVDQRLRADGVDVDAARASGRLLSLDAHETLARFMRNGEPDGQLFDAVIGGLMSERATVANGGRLRAYGEMVDVLWKSDQKSAALHLEELWNDLQSRRSFTLLCAYAMGQFYKEPATIHGVCATHTQIVGLKHDGKVGLPARATSVPAHYAEALAREILHREEVELALRQSLRELRAKEEELLRSERQLQLITDALPVCVSYVDRDGRYRFVSAAYERWFGRAKHELLGRRVEDVVGPDAYRIVGPNVERALAGETVTYHEDVSFRDGRRGSVEATYIPQLAQDRRVAGFVALVSDVSERKAFERFRTVAASRAERLVKITAAVAEAVTTDEVLTAVVDNVAAAVDASSAALWLVDEDGRSARLARAFGYEESTTRKFDRAALDANPSIPVVDAIRRGEPIWIPSQAALLRDYPHLQGSITAGRSYRISCLPLISGDRTLGALGLTIEEPREAEEEERGFLLLVARYAAQAIERLRLFDAERRSKANADAAAARLALLNNRAEQLYRFAQSVVAADRVEVVFEAALTALEAAVGANRAAVLIFDGDGVMRFRASRNLSETYRRAVEGHSPWQRDAVAPEPVLVPDVDTDPSMQPFLPMFRDEGIGSLGFIPLVTRGRLIGKFMVYYRERHEYSPHEIDLATAIASHLASVTVRFEAIAKLEETIRTNELFAGVLAHDLRSPLGAIMTAAQIVLMRQEGQGDRVSRPASRIISSGQRMTRMIDQLLDVTRARSGGGIHVDPCDTNLADLYAQASGELELAFPQWSLRREIVGNLAGRWDPDRLLQIVSNLLSNAGQHGRPEGVVTVRLDGSEAETVILDVHNGGSIPASVMPSLFDPFRGTRSRRDSSRGLGLGLGLFIVKEITEAHGGTVQVSSSEPEGTRFVVRLPRWCARPSGSEQRGS